MAIIKDDKGRWGFSVRYTDTFGNTKQKKSVNKEWTKKQAKLEEEKFLKSVSYTAITLNQLRDIYMRSMELKIRESTRLRKNNMYRKHIEPSLGNVNIDKIDESVIEEWQSKIIKTNLKAASMHVIQSELTATLRFGYKRKYLKRMPFVDRITLNVPEEDKKKFITKEQFDILCDHIQRNYDEHLYTMVQLLYYSGLRIGEALAISTSDLNGNVLNVSKSLSSATNKISRTKNGRNRYVVLSDRIVELLNEREQHYRKCGMQNDVYYFGGTHPFSYKYIGYYYEKACREVNVQPNNLHSLRHSHVSNLIKLGFNVFEISERTGHSPNMIESTYGHILDDPQVKMAKMLEKL